MLYPRLYGTTNLVRVVDTLLNHSALIMLNIVRTYSPSLSLFLRPLKDIVVANSDAATVFY